MFSFVDYRAFLVAIFFSYYVLAFCLVYCYFLCPMQYRFLALRKFFFPLLHYSFLCFCPVQLIFLFLLFIFFILAMRNAIAFLTLHYYVFSFALHYVFFSFAQRVFFFWLLSLLCAIQFIFFPLTYFFSCLALPYFCAFRSRHSARYFFSLTCNFDFAWPLTIPFCRALFLYWRPLAFLARAPFAPFSRALVRTLCALFCRAFISLLAHTHC